MAEHTPLPWSWTIEDYSMAILHGPDYLGDSVMGSSPCEACRKRANPKEWVWGRCTTPSKADAALIVKAVNMHARLVEELRSITVRFQNCLRHAENGQWAVDEATEKARALLVEAEDKDDG